MAVVNFLALQAQRLAAGYLQLDKPEGAVLDGKQHLGTAAARSGRPDSAGSAADQDGHRRRVNLINQLSFKLSFKLLTH